MPIFAFSLPLTITFIISKKQNIQYESNLREPQIQCQIVKSSFYSPGKPHPTAVPTRLQQTPTTVQHRLTLKKDPVTPIQPYINPTNRRDCASIKHWHAVSTTCVNVMCSTVATNKCMKKKG